MQKTYRQRYAVSVATEILYCRNKSTSRTPWYLTSVAQPIRIPDKIYYIEMVEFTNEYVT